MNIVVNYAAVPCVTPPTSCQTPINILDMTPRLQQSFRIGFQRLWFDIGANVGKWSMANIPACDTIIALEPDPDTFVRLRQTTRDHPNIQCINYAASSQYPAATEIAFYKCSTEHTLSTLNPEWLASETSRFYGEPYSQITCNAISLDRLIELYGVPSLIKVDVEGGEYDCLCSLTQKVDQLCFEWASEVNHITFQCLDHLQTIGFTQFYVQYGDEYTFRPVETEYTNADTVKNILTKTVPKYHHGMIWCR